MYLAVLLFCAGVAVGFDDAWRWPVFALLALVLHLKAGLEERRARGTVSGLRRVRPAHAGADPLAALAVDRPGRGARRAGGATGAIDLRSTVRPMARERAAA